MRYGIAYFQFVFVAVILSGCWSSPNDYWQEIDTTTDTDTDKDTEEVDGGKNFDADKSIDGGV